jgi:hypothetical protein
MVALAAAIIAAGCSLSSDVTRTLGARCDVKEECDDRCLRPSDKFPGGFCSVSCAGDSECPEEAACVNEEGGVCLFECQDDPDCGFLGVGWQCDTKSVLPDGEAKVCIGD